MRWLAIKIDRFASLTMVFSVVIMNSLAFMSSPLDGSSAMSRSGSWMMAHASFVACFMPVEKLPISR